jgi:hypothetical protein
VTGYRFMKENRRRYPAGKTAGLFGASCGACYRRARYGVSERRRRADAELRTSSGRYRERVTAGMIVSQAEDVRLLP